MDIIKRILDISNYRVQTYLKEQHIIPRPGAGAGVWMSFLLPISVIISANTSQNVTEVYKIAATLSYGLLATSAIFLLSDSKNRQDKIFLIPPVFTYANLFFSNKIGIWFSMAGGFASYSLSEAVILLLDASPKSLTYGEASILIQSLILFLYTASINLVDSWYHTPVDCMGISTVILQVGLIGVLLICAGAYFFPDFRIPLPFCGLTLTTLFGFVIPLLHILLQKSPVLWIIQLLFDNQPRVLLVIYWVICSGLGVMTVALQIGGKQQASTVVRKNFHILAVVVFIPGLIRECCFLYLATGVVLALFTALELLRVLNMPLLGDMLQAGFKVFADEKDAGSLALTPIYLLAGCSLPLWLYPASCMHESCIGQYLLPLMSGILTIGIGDTAASAFGTWIGRTKWRGTKKTIEGTIASIFFKFLPPSIGYITSSTIMFVWSTFAVVVTSVLEAKTDQVDNLALPLVMYILLLPLSSYFC
ncbi:hypothetical protein L9F63_000983 [Diploptera punctata]|uniref:dolichol kinase n=1 Tax=Diploptera punctata TaxID=6984 RepID=A0AAD8ALK9_DIPPU|nr:hypothetical protein L9F63_000983 [Diploptera punctata]